MDDALVRGIRARRYGDGRVLILVVMDDALVLLMISGKTVFRSVLILVVMDDALVPTWLKRLKPSSNNKS